LTKILFLSSFHFLFLFVSNILSGCDSLNVSESNGLKTQLKSRDLSKFEIFETKEAADLHAQELNSGYTIVREQSSRRTEVEAALEKMFQAYRAEYPHETSGLPVPKLVIYESNASEARMGTIAGKVIWYIFVGSGILDSKFSLEAIMALFAHEVTHGVQSGDNWSVEKFYFATDKAEPLGILQADDPIARKLGNTWITNAVRVGAISLSEANGLPIGASASIYPSFLKDLHRKYVSNNPLCHTANALQKELTSLLSKSFSVVEMEYDLTDIKKVELERISRMYRESLNCIGGKTANFYDDLTHWVGIPFIEYVNLNIGKKSIVQGFESDIAKANEAENSIKGLLLVSEKIQLDMRMLELNSQFKHLRRYTAEDLADNASVNVMKRFARPEALNDFFWTAYGEMLQICSTYKRPPYGNLNDIHHGFCYRIDRIKAYAAFLSK